MPRKEEDSLGQDFTRMGDEESPKPPESQRSLGDQSTFGDAGSSVSDVGGLDDTLDSDMEVVDLSDRYEIEGVIGKGGMGEVLRARDKRLDRPVAIKRILGQMARSKKALARFLTEAQSVAKLNHFNIVQIYDYGRAADGPFIIMELIEGQSLQDKLKEGPLELEAAVEMTCQLCDALSTAHEAGIIHRDIKPANILLTQRGEAKLTDFGLARQDTTDHGQTQKRTILGTLVYMAPEQSQDGTLADARSDLWSLAATLYQMVTGKTPKVIRLHDVPQELQEILSKALEDDKDARYQTAADFGEVLRSVLDGTIALNSEVDRGVELVEGQCRSCRKMNESSRKFCKSCGANLRELCLNCELYLPVWETFCPDCGLNLPESIQGRLAELEQQKKKVESLRREYQYEPALELNARIKELATTRFVEHGAWAETMSQTLKSEYSEQRTRRDNLVAQSQLALDNHRHEEVLKLLGEVPISLQNHLCKSLLTSAKSQQQETLELLKEIKHRLAKQELDDLWDRTARFLKLNPQHKEVSDLHQKLLTRKRDNSTAAALLDRAERAYKGCNDNEVVKLFTKWPPAVKQPERVNELLELVRMREKHALKLRQDIEQAIAAQELDGVLPKVEKYLLLRPGDVQVARLTEMLLEYEKNKHRKITNSVGMALNLIPQGEFKRTTHNLKYVIFGWTDETVVKITKDFYLSSCLVTQAQYEAVMGATPWRDRGPYVKEGVDFPATHVSWNAANKFCQKLSDQEGEEYRIPTEAEWEYACRAGTTTAYSFGNDASQLRQYAWYFYNHEDGLGPHPVGGKLPNPWGLYDMHGNVWEWTQSVNPYGSYTGKHQFGVGVTCGGAFDSRPHELFPTSRYPAENQREVSWTIGFRVARTYNLSP